MRLLLTKIDILDEKGHYAKIKVIQGSKKTEQIKANIVKKEKKSFSRSSLTSNTGLTPNDNFLSLSTPLSSNIVARNSLASNGLISLSMKGDN